MTRHLILGLFSLSALAACGGRDQIVIELSGAVPGATRVDVTLLEPMVLAKLQRRYDANTTPVPSPSSKETVFYVAQRSAVGFELGNDQVAGLQFELKDTDGSYVPLVVVRDAQGVRAMGIYHPDSVFAAKVGEEHVPDAVEPVSDVTIYTIQLEMVTGGEAATQKPTVIDKNAVMVVRCGPGGSVSGAVWRRGVDDKQLRLLLPLDGGSGSAVDRLDAPDLDCDMHSAGPAGIEARGTGDERDCDDIAFAVHGGTVERCSTFDEDCDLETTVSAAGSSEGCQCPLSGNICVCVDASLPQPKCPTAFQTCTFPTKSNGTGGRTPCDGRGDLVALPDCATGGCMATLTWVPPGWDVRIGGDHGINEPVPVPLGGTLPMAIKETGVLISTSGVGPPLAALLSVTKGIGPAATVVVKLAPGGETCTNSTISCM